MPYLEAVILETLRLSSILPYGIIHELLDDTTFGEFRLAKGTLLFANMYHVHYNKDIWGDPENFRPERFLQGNEEEKRKLKGCIVAFQPGKRVCPGEALAKDVLFLMTAQIFHKYTISPVEGKMKSEYIEPHASLLLHPRPVGLIIKSGRLA